MRSAPAAPRCSPLARAVGRGFLRLLGWRVEGEAPPIPRFVVLGAPHTSNWDLPVVLASAWALGVRIHWLAKRELFVPGVAPLLRAMGGIAVDRSAPRGLVAQLAQAFASRDRLALMIPPDGTRGRREGWKSGFYHVARAADVPVVASYADYARKCSGIAGTLRLSGDVRADMDAIRRLYAGVVPRHPEWMTPIRLAAEDEPGAGPRCPQGDAAPGAPGPRE